MTTILVLIGLILFAFFLPARYDPAIRLKEWNERDK